MWKYFLVLLCSFVTLVSFGQNSAERVNDLLDEAKNAFKVNSDSARHLEETALKIAKSINYEEGIVRSHFYLGYYYDKGVQDYQNSIRNYLDAIRYSSFSHDSTSLGWALYAHLNAAKILNDFGLSTSSMQFLKSAREIALHLNNSMRLDAIDFEIYLRLASLNEYNEGLQVLRGLHARTTDGSGQNLNSLNSIGVCYAYLGDFEKSKNTYLEVIRLAQENNNTVYEDFGMHNLGDLLIKNKKWGEAEIMLNKVLKAKLGRSNDVSKDKNLLSTYNDLLMVKNKLGKSDYVLEIQEELDLLIPEVKKENPDYYFQIYPTMANSYNAIGKSDKAREFSSIFIRDSIAHAQIKNRIDFELEKNKLEEIVGEYYAELDQERQEIRSKNLLLSAIVGLSFLLVMLVTYHFLTRYRVRKMLAQSLEQVKWDD